MSLIYKSLQRLEERSDSLNQTPGLDWEDQRRVSAHRPVKLLLACIVMSILLFLAIGVWSLESGSSDQEGAVPAVLAEKGMNSSRDIGQRKQAGDPSVKQVRPEVQHADHEVPALQQGRAELQADSPANPADRTFPLKQAVQGNASRRSPGFTRKDDVSPPELVGAEVSQDNQIIRLSLEFTSRPEVTTSRHEEDGLVSVHFTRGSVGRRALFRLLSDQDWKIIKASIHDQGRHLALAIPGVQEVTHFILPTGMTYGPRVVCDVLLSPSKQPAMNPAGDAFMGSLRADARNGMKNGTSQVPSPKAAGVQQAQDQATNSSIGTRHDRFPRPAAAKPAVPLDPSGPVQNPQTTNSEIRTGQPDMTKTVRAPKSPGEQAEKLMLAANSALNKGDWFQAEEFLRQALSKAPAHVQARQTLASIHIRTGRAQQAKQVLRLGLDHAPEAIILRSLLAGILIREKDWSGVLKVLNHESRPQINEQPEYFAMMAYTFRKREDFAQAAHLYSSLCRMQPDTGTWWIGLGLSREGLNEASAAARAYETALECQNLTAPLRAFVQDRKRTVTAQQ